MPLHIINVDIVSSSVLLVLNTLMTKKAFAMMTTLKGSLHDFQWENSFGNENNRKSASVTEQILFNFGGSAVLICVSCFSSVLCVACVTHHKKQTTHMQGKRISVGGFPKLRWGMEGSCLSLRFF